MSHCCARVILAGVLIGALLIASPAQANRFRDNPEHPLDRAKETWTSPIGELERDVTPNKNGRGGDTASVGTAFLVSPCYIATAAHVVYGEDLDPVKGKDYSLVFRAGVSQTSAFAGHTTATPVASGSRDNAGRGDWALMQLSVCIGARRDFGWLEIGGRSLGKQKGERIVSLGYAATAERGSLSIGHGKTREADAVTGMTKIDASFLPGESGGPVLLIEDGRIVVSGMNVSEMSSIHGAAYDHYRLDIANLVLDISEVLSRRSLRALLDADKAAFGQPNPAAERLRMDHLPE